MDEDIKKSEYLTNLKSALKAKYSMKYAELCIGYAQRLLEYNLPVIFDIDHLSILLNVEKKKIYSFVYKSENYYNEFEIEKKSGGRRIIEAPSLELKRVQRWILDNILKEIKVSKYATGFLDEKSIVDNAKIHLNQTCLLNMDIKDFFPSIVYEDVFRIFKYHGYTKRVSWLLAKLCTLHNCLPQGAPTSPAISNIVCLRLDKRLSCLARTYDAKYSRYADDITFSGDINIINAVSISRKILKDEGFQVNDKKTRYLLPHQRQEVTGIVINGGELRVNKKYKKNLEYEIYYCTKYGVQNHLDKIGCTKAFYKEHLYGKAYFVKMVNELEGEKLLKKLDQLKWNY